MILSSLSSLSSCNRGDKLKEKGKVNRLRKEVINMHEKQIYLFKIAFQKGDIWNQQGISVVTD